MGLIALCVSLAHALSTVIYIYTYFFLRNSHPNSISCFKTCLREEYESPPFEITREFYIEQSRAHRKRHYRTYTHFHSHSLYIPIHSLCDLKYRSSRILQQKREQHSRRNLQKYAACIAPSHGFRRSWLVRFFDSKQIRA